MKKLFLIFLLICFSCKSTKNKTSEIKNVLFIGNSLTYFHDMPSMVQEMLNETHYGINVEQSTFPGMSLDSHLDEIITSSSENSISTRKKEVGEQTKTEKKILEKNWDVIILQGGTVSFLIPEARKYNNEVAIEKIKSIVTNSNCRFLLFSTWPSKKSYPKQYCYSENMINYPVSNGKHCSENFTELKTEVEFINKAYQAVANSQNLEKSNNTDRVYEILKKHKELNLYEDNIHPNALGSFLNACVFYQMISGEKAFNLKYEGNISSENAKLLKSIVK